MYKYLYAIFNWKAWVRALIDGTTVPVHGGRMVMQGTLNAVVIKKDGKCTDYGVISKRVVTTAGVNFLRDDFNGGTTDVSTMNYHDSGVGVAAEAIGDTDLGTPSGPTTRATGVQSAPATKQYRSVGTITYSGPLAITEHGLFNQAARGGGSVLWDRSVFSPINVAASDSIQFTYTLSISDGG
jgi:hypothetical protein